jgi:hypothetical protein
MKWGVRRTRAQLAKASAKRKEYKNSADAKVKAERKALASKRRTLADGDIEKLTKRLEAEKKLKTLVDEDTAPGKREVKDTLKSIGTKSAKTIGTATVTAVGAHYAQKGLKAKGVDLKDFKLPKK